MWGLAFYQENGLSCTIDEYVEPLLFVEVIDLLLYGNSVDGIIEFMYQLVDDPLPHFFFRCGTDIPLSDRVEKR